MFGFRPTRSSPPARPTEHPQVPNSKTRTPAPTTSADLSRSSAFSAVPELAGLSSNDVELIDAIIERAGPTATTFLTVFKAYNDILGERGLDPHEVIYYGKLLKLGTLKGSSWSEKWNAIKAQNGYGSEVQTDYIPQPALILRKQTVPVTIPHAGPSTLTDDLFSSSSALHRSQRSETEDGTVFNDLQRYPASSTLFPSRRGPSPSDMTNNTLGIEIDDDVHRALSVPASSHLLSRPTLRPWEYEISEPVTTSTPPSYRAVTRDLPARSKSPMSPALWTKRPERPPLAQLPATVAQPKEKRDSVINEEDAWKKVRMMQDEKEADKYREERLIERCFDVWRQGFQWIITTNEQIDDARDEILQRELCQRWHQHTMFRQAKYERAAAFANRQCLRTFFRHWKQCVKQRTREKQQAEWRHDMRNKINIVRQKRDTKLQKDAWAKWRQSHQSRLGDQYYAEQLVIRFYRRWKTRLRGTGDKEAIADEWLRDRMEQAVVRYWDHWRSCTDLARTEKMVSERVGLRVMGEALDTWKKKTIDVQTADAFFNVIVSKQCIRSWKAARDRIRSLEVRANKHIARQDDVLLRAVMRVWKAHERGALYGKVKSFRLAKRAWAVWKVRINNQRKLEDLALQFSTRLDSSTAKNALQLWQRVVSTHRNAEVVAIQYGSTQLLSRALLQWRLRLHERLKLTKKARIAEKFFVLHRFWNLFKEKYRERTSNRKLQSFEQMRVKKAFDTWLQRSRSLRQQRLSEEFIKDIVRKRILSNALTYWTNRVIEIKVRELETSQRTEAKLLINSFEKWKKVRSRHVEELRLLESYKDIKRAESVCRIFNKWLTATRTARHRRLVLQRKEDELKLTTIAVAWDQWRERFKDERLKPLEYKFLLQEEHALKYRAFATWVSKTQTLPAIHFDAKRVKTRYWKVWMSAMPRALQAKTARVVDQRAVLKKSLDKWLQVYRTKLSLKAVARARYFPAPSAAPTRSFPVSRPFPALSYASRNNFPRRASRPESSDDEEPGPSEPPPVPRSARLGSRLLPPPTKARSEASPTRTLISKTRASSPARSTKSSVPAPWYMRDRSPVRSPAPPTSAGGQEERSSLWQALQDVRRKSQTPSESSRRERKPP